MKKSHSIYTEEQINEIVNKCVNVFFEEVTRGDKSVVIEGCVPEVGNYLETFNTPKRSVLEGLIRTYPTNSVVNILVKECGLSKEQIQVCEIPNEDDRIVTELICVILKRTVNREEIGKITHTMKTCGYFPTGSFTISKVNPNFGTIYFEPKFMKDVAQELRDKCQYLFHSTSSTLVGKIMEKGLIPHSKNSKYNYPDRIYFMRGDKLSKRQINAIRDVQMTRNNTFPEEKNPNDELEYSLLTIDISKIPNNVKFYDDPLSPQAVFTYDNIPPSAIISVSSFTL